MKPMDLIIVLNFELREFLNYKIGQVSSFLRSVNEIGQIVGCIINYIGLCFLFVLVLRCLCLSFHEWNVDQLSIGNKIIQTLPFLYK